MTTATMRRATVADAPQLARLHAERISEGFLPTLGQPFLERLYRRIARSGHAFAVVAVDGAAVVGFAAGATSTGALYKEFILRDGVAAGLRALPRIVRSLPRVVETLRHPAAAADLPAAEVLSVAVAPAASGRGLGQGVVREVLAELARRGVQEAKVVVGSDNAPAIAMYLAAGFARPGDDGVPAAYAVHEGVAEEVLVWRS